MLNSAGVLSGKAASYLDFELPERLIERKIFGVRLHYWGLAIEKRKTCRLASLVSRKLFDNFLLNKARETGIEVHTREKVLDCREKEECIEVITSKGRYLARFVLIAEGSQGTFKHRVMLQKDLKNITSPLSQRLQKTRKRS